MKNNKNEAKYNYKSPFLLSLLRVEFSGTYLSYFLGFWVISHVIQYFMFKWTGDEILAVNGSILHGLSHGDAIAIFKSIRSGPVVLQIARRNTGMSSTTNLTIRQSRPDLQSGRLRLPNAPSKENVASNAR